MRIGMMVDTYKPYLSGITNYIELNKRRLEQVGHDVFVFTFGNLDHPDDETHIIRSPGLPLVDTGFFINFRYSRQAKSLLQTMDVVHVHHPFLSGRLALRYCKPLNIPVVFTNHTRYDLYAQAYLPSMPEGLSMMLLENYMPRFCADVDMVISPSAGMAEVLRQFRVSVPITIAPNGVDLTRYSSLPEPVAHSQLGIPEQACLLIYSGRLSTEKNLALLLQAFLGVAQAVTNVHLLLVGGGPQQSELEYLCSQHPEGQRVHFTGRVDYELIPAYLAAGDIFVTASISEVHPLSVIEAMAAGLPVVGIHSPGISDTVEDGVTGFLSTEDLSAFTAKLTRLCLDPALRARMGAAACSAAQRYAIERTAATLLGHYESLVLQARKRKRGPGYALRSLLEKFRQ